MKLDPLCVVYRGPNFRTLSHRTLSTFPLLELVRDEAEFWLSSLQYEHVLANFFHIGLSTFSVSWPSSKPLGGRRRLLIYI